MRWASSPDVGTAWSLFTRSIADFFGNTALMIGLAVLAGLAVLGIAVLRRHGLHRRLAQRVTIELKPSEEFTASLDEVQAIAKRWSRVRPSAHRLFNRWLGPAGAHALRVTLLTDDEGLLRYRLTVPPHAVPLISASGYKAVEVRQIDRATGDEELVPTLAAWLQANGLPAGFPAADDSAGVVRADDESETAGQVVDEVRS
ncbi:hypothetical protein [Kutzneria buriramensis]|uniref:Uncharacterized protein n=1 Tax=Kutzneria buriramensis TaxID=1045776 RepID=A0A3E0GVX8_9PSEU|nr:hypothetical protein [Kutzneria buriramensis]REH31017.1 hypothetical protein BCF44_12240 [Kutzneria buriramensis]